VTDPKIEIRLVRAAAQGYYSKAASLVSSLANNILRTGYEMNRQIGRLAAAIAFLTALVAARLPQGRVNQRE
jgi:hypothetical protein